MCVVNRMLQPAKSPHGQPTIIYHTTLSDSSTTVNKSQQCPVNSQRKTATAESQHSQVKVNVQPRFLCQKMQTSEIRILGEIRVSLTKH